MLAQNALFEHTPCGSAIACHASLIDDSVYPCYSVLRILNMRLLGPLITNTPRAFPYASPWSSMGSVVVPYVQFRLFWVLLLPHYVSFHIVAHAICDYIVLAIVISMPFRTFPFMVSRVPLFLSLSGYSHSSEYNSQ